MNKHEAKAFAQMLAALQHVSPVMQRRNLAYSLQAMVREAIEAAEAPAPKGGRPVSMDDSLVFRLHMSGLTNRAIARKIGVTHGAIALSLKRTAKDES